MPVKLHQHNSTKSSAFELQSVQQAPLVRCNLRCTAVAVVCTAPFRKAKANCSNWPSARTGAFAPLAASTAGSDTASGREMIWRLICQGRRLQLMLQSKYIAGTPWTSHGEQENNTCPAPLAGRRARGERRAEGAGGGQDGGGYLVSAPSPKVI